MKAVLVEHDLLTAYGHGIDAAWSGLLSRQTAVRPVARFPTGAFTSHVAATLDVLDPGRRDSLCGQMLRLVLDPARLRIPRDAFVLLATTVGEIDLLERSLLGGDGRPEDSAPARLLEKVCALCGTRGDGMVISAACASSGAALAQAAALIRDGRADGVLVVACDSVTEFVFSGFSSLMALDSHAARPFDRRRRGLSLGEAAAAALLMSEERARREGRRVAAAVAGWGLSNDANHMTGPSRDGSGLAAALRQALHSAGVAASDIAFISAHGTGTPYNDAMELKAFKQVFTARPLPTYSVKGAIGHTLGAAGLVETLIALHALRAGRIPSTVNLAEVDDAAAGWAAAAPVAVSGRHAAIVNAGFGGINSALVISREET